MLIYLNLQGLQTIVQAPTKYILDEKILSGNSDGNEKTFSSNFAKKKLKEVEKNYVSSNNREELYLRDNGYNSKIQQKIFFAAINNFTLNKYVNSNTQTFIEQKDDNTLTTDNSLISSDFNAKDNSKILSKNSSQSNVPEKKFNRLNDYDHLSFISNGSYNYNSIRFYDKKKKQKSIEKKNVEDLPPDSHESLAKQQRDILMQVTDFGLQEMFELFEIKEKKIFEKGIFLPKSSPGSYLAAFNHQSPEVKKFARFGYASLRATAQLVTELAHSKFRQEMFNVSEDSTKDFPEISLLDTSLHEVCPLKDTPICPVWNHLFRTMDGTCNNLKHPWWGSRFQPLKRFLAPHYDDGLEAIRRSVKGGLLPSARLISTEIHWDKNVESKSVTHLLMQWGQFLDHDMTSSSQSRGFSGSVPRCCDAPPDLQHPDCLPIEVLPDDRFFSRFGIRCLEFLRSAPSSRVGCALGPREQINQVTSYIDGSMIYGNSERESSKLRLFRNGMLKYTRMPQRLPLLPIDRNKGEFCRKSTPDFFCLHSGDSRMNEQPGLLAIHIVFLRLHNRLTRNLAHLNPEWNDERLFQETRKIVGAIIQHITYREFLPIVLGQDVMSIFDIELLKNGYYQNYSESVSSTAANAFATAAFRFGHSMVQGKFLKWDDIRKEEIINVPLHDELLDTGSLHRFGAVDNLMLGMCRQGAQKRDEHFTVELTNHLFQTPNFPAGLDLAAINIQRGRDHGLPSYNSWRNPCGLRRMKNWNDLLHVMPEESRDALRRIYRDVNDIDLYTGGLAESSVRGGLVGSTFACIIAQNFRNLRKGDRFWYENGGFESSFTVAQLKAIRRVTLARILCDNLDLSEEIQPFVFLTEDNIRNPKISCRSREIPFIDLTPWQELNKGKWNQKEKETPVEIPFLEIPTMKSDLKIDVEIPKPIE